MPSTTHTTQPQATERETHIRGKFERWGLHCGAVAEDLRDLLALLDEARAEAAALRERAAYQQALLASLMAGDGGKIAGVDPLREDLT